MFGIKAKIMSLVLLPLIGQVLLVGATFHSLQVAQKHSAKAAESKAILSRLQTGGQRYSAMCQSIAKAALSKDDAQYRLAYDAIAGSQKELIDCSGVLGELQDPEAVHVQSLADFTAALARESLRFYLAGDERMGNHFFRELAKNAKKLMKVTVAIRKKYAAVSSNVLDEELAARSRLKNLVLVGAIANLALCSGLGLWFYTDAIRRFKRVRENAILLGRRSPLLQQVDGADEITRLDQTFHQVADAINSGLHKLSQSETFARTIVDSVPQPLFAVAMSGRIESVTKSASEAFLYSEEEMKGKLIQELLLLVDDKLEPGTCGQAIASKAQRRDGSTFPCEIVLSAVRFTQEDKLLINVRDVTEQRQAEEWRQEFVAMISHDLRTPLTAINLSLECLKEGVFGSPSVTEASSLQESTEQCEQVVKTVSSLLDLEKLQLEGPIDATQIIELDGIIAESIEAVEDFALRSNTRIDFEKHYLDVSGSGQMLLVTVKSLLEFTIANSESRLITITTAEGLESTTCTIAGLSKDLAPLNKLFAGETLSNLNLSQRERFQLEMVKIMLSRQAMSVEVTSNGAECAWVLSCPLPQKSITNS